jgi:hypothetical protein
VSLISIRRTYRLGGDPCLAQRVHVTDRRPGCLAPRNHCPIRGATRQITVTPDEVVVVPGGNNHFYHLAPGEEATKSSIESGFPIYESMINFMGPAVPIQLREEMDFRLNVDEFASLINIA